MYRSRPHVPVETNKTTESSMTIYTLDGDGEAAVRVTLSVAHSKKKKEYNKTYRNTRIGLVDGRMQAACPQSTPTTLQ